MHREHLNEQTRCIYAVLAPTRIEAVFRCHSRGQADQLAIGCSVDRPGVCLTIRCHASKQASTEHGISCVIFYILLEMHEFY